MLKNDGEVLWSYLDQINETKQCPRSALLHLAQRNEENLGKWLYHLIHEDGLVREEWRDSRLYVFKTDRGEVWH